MIVFTPTTGNHRCTDSMGACCVGQCSKSHPQ